MISQIAPCHGDKIKMNISSILPISTSRQWGVRLLGLAISVAIAGYLVAQIDTQQFLALIGNVSAPILLGTFAIYMLLNFSRAMRFSVLLGGISARLLYPIALYHNFLVRTLPFKTGELSYVVLTRHYLRRSLVEGVGSLVSARLFDLLVVATGCTIGLLTVAGSNADPTLFLLFVPCLIASTIILYFAAPLLRKISALEHHLLRNRALGTSDSVRWIDQKTVVLIDNLERIHTPRLFAILIGLSIGNYVCSASFDLLLINALGITAPFGTLVVVVSIAMFAEALPFSVAGFGLVEGGWTLGLLTFIPTLSAPKAVSAAFFLHACQLVSVALSGLVGYGLLHTSTFRRRVQPKADEGL
jgi:uncharacterized membrane protein YbhN (UPF0104 family)